MLISPGINDNFCKPGGKILNLVYFVLLRSSGGIWIGPYGEMNQKWIMMQMSSLTEHFGVLKKFKLVPSGSCSSWKQLQNLADRQI